METLFLLVLALLPCFILLFFILYMDRNEREPMGQVLKVILLGALSVVPAVFIERWLGLLPIYGGQGVISGILEAFVQVAWVEELCKLGVVLLFVWKNRHFNEENDGIVYVGASALGFAMLENVAYVLSSGLNTGLLRAITAIPLHCFTGVLMGYYTGLAKFSSTARERRRLIFKGFFWAYMVHGVYDALLMTHTYVGILIFPLIVGLIIFGVRFLKKGRQLSLARTAGEVQAPAPVDIATQQEILVRMSPKNQWWKIAISRTLFLLCGLFWLVILLGLVVKLETFKEKGEAILLGAVILTVIPVFIALLLEVSYRHKKRVYVELRKTVPEPESFRVYTGAKPVSDTIMGTTLAAPPGQLWRVIVARVFFTLSALVWALILLVLSSDRPGGHPNWPQILLFAFIITFLPVYIGWLLENSYQQRKKRFSQLLSIYPNGRIPAEKLAITPAGQVWKIVIARFLFGVMVVVTASLILVHLLPDYETAPSFQLLSDCLLVNLIPFFIAMPLELSYRQKKKLFETAQNETGETI